MSLGLVILLVCLAVGLLALLTVIGSRSRERHLDDDLLVDDIRLEPELRDETTRGPRFQHEESEEPPGRFSRRDPEAEEAEEAEDEHTPPEAPPR